MGPAALIVDDDGAFRDLAAMLFTTRGCAEVFEADDGEQAVATFGRRRPDWVLIDVHLADARGTTVARALIDQAAAASVPPPRVVLTSTDPNAISAEEVVGCGAVAFVAKDELATADLAVLFTRAGT